MKIRLLFAAFFAVLGLIVLSANRNGRASVSGAGNTGAPGDETNINGTPRTCAYCHFNGAIQSATSITVLDTTGATVTDYLPGHTYTVRVAVATLAGNPTRYGFQMIALRDSSNTDLDGFSDPGTSNNYKIATIANGRTYAEQNTASTSPTFDVVWTAPTAGTGPITIYAAGNAVNNNQLSTGDGPSNTNLHLVEATSSINAGPAPLALRVFPSRLRADAAHFQLVAPAAGPYRLTVLDYAGRRHWQTELTLQAGVNTVMAPIAEWPAGFYVLAAEHNERRGTVVLIKL